MQSGQAFYSVTEEQGDDVAVARTTHENAFSRELLT